MAVAERVSSRLRLVFYDGEDILTGNPIFKSKTFNNLKTDADADQFLAVAEAFAGLQERPLSRIERNDNTEIREA